MSEIGVDTDFRYGSSASSGAAQRLVQFSDSVVMPVEFQKRPGWKMSIDRLSGDDIFDMRVIRITFSLREGGTAHEYDAPRDHAMIGFRIGQH